MELIAAIALCVPAVPVATIEAVVIHESGGNPYAINLNGRYRLSRVPRTRREAVATLDRLRSGAFGSYDIGLGQINSIHLERLRLTPEQLLDSCTNLRVVVRLLGECQARTGAPAPAEMWLARTLSCYHTGDPLRGIRNGYVGRVYRAAARPETVTLPIDSLDTAPTTASSSVPVDALSSRRAPSTGISP